MTVESSQVLVGGLRDEEAMGKAAFGLLRSCLVEMADAGKSSSEEESITITRGRKIGGEEGRFAGARCLGGVHKSIGLGAGTLSQRERGFAGARHLGGVHKSIGLRAGTLSQRERGFARARRLGVHKSIGL